MNTVSSLAIGAALGLIIAYLLVLANSRPIDGLLDRFEAERDTWRHERQLLLNRIKPETAQAVMDPTLLAGKSFQSAVPYDDDEAYWESKEAFAERLMAEELNGAG